MANAAVITDLLNKLSSEHKEISWQMRCCFADGKHQSFHTIHLRRKYSKEEKIIVFEMESGQLVKYGCKGLDVTDNADIIDVLLDIINEQKRSADKHYQQSGL